MSPERIELFNGQSYIELVDFSAMGNRRGKYRGDWALADGARVSFGRKASEFPFKRNKGLVEEIWDASDASPLTKFIMQFRVRVPVHIALEWFLFPFAEYNEISGRYTQVISKLEGCFVPPDFPPELAGLLRSDFLRSQVMYKSLYNPKKFEAGEKQVAKELARLTLLYSFSTEFIFDITLRKLAHFMMVFGANPLFFPINEAFLIFLKRYSPIFAARFEPFWRELTAQKPPLSNPTEIPFSDDEIGILGDDFSALQLRKVIGSDEELADTIRFSRGYKGSNLEVIKKLVTGCRRDDLSPELSEIGLRLAIRCPIFIFRQMYRHKRPAWYGLQTFPHKFYVPKQWRAQTKRSRYVFEPFEEKENTQLTRVFAEYIEERRNRYARLLLEGVPLNHAERFLPYCFYVSVMRNGDGIDLFNFLNLRCDWHAQYEHQQSALRTAEIFAEHFPLAFLSWFEGYRTGENQRLDELYRRTKSTVY